MDERATQAFELMKKAKVLEHIKLAQDLAKQADQQIEEKSKTAESLVRDIRGIMGTTNFEPRFQNIESVEEQLQRKNHRSGQLECAEKVIRLTKLMQAAVAEPASIVCSFKLKIEAAFKDTQKELDNLKAVLSEASEALLKNLDDKPEINLELCSEVRDHYHTARDFVKTLEEDIAAEHAKAKAIFLPELTDLNNKEKMFVEADVPQTHPPFQAVIQQIASTKAVLKQMEVIDGKFESMNADIDFIDGKFGQAPSPASPPKKKACIRSFFSRMF
jgi:hypothetical protein